MRYPIFRVGEMSMKKIIIFLMALSIFALPQFVYAEEDIYDVILFWGQSNMYGASTAEAETRHLNRQNIFARETATDISIVNNIVNRA